MLKDLDLASWMCKYDFVLLVETFTDSVPDTLFPFHDIFVCPGVKVSDSVHGRLCGGLAVLVRKELSKHVEQVPLEFDNIIALKISHALLGLDNDCIFIGVYLPPENSKYYADTDIYNGVAMLEDCMLDINSRYGNVPMVVCGDLNSRTASKNSCISRDPIDDVYDMDNSDECESDLVCYNARLSKDHVINSFGKYLLNVCNEFRLSIVNGLKRFSFASDYTYIAQNGCSVIDLFVLSHDLLDKCTEFNVLPIVESKHAAVELSLSCVQFQYDTISNNRPHFYFSKYKWDPEKSVKFCDFMRSDQVAAVIDEASHLIEFDINLALDKLNECFKSAGECMMNTISIGTEKRRVWFDLECKQSRTVLRQHLRKVNRLSNEEVRLSYTSKRREYKNLLKQKRQTYKDNFLQELQTNLNDSKKFWDTIRSVRPRSGCQSNISKEQWFNHFKSVFSSEYTSENESLEPDLVYVNASHDDIVNCCISEIEIRNAIGALKSNRAAGPDGIIGEFYKNSADCIIPFLVKYFNYIFDNGLFPEVWSLAVLLPLHKKGDINNPDNFRGISLLNICSKIYSFILNKRINNWVEVHGLIGEEQAGFKAEHSTADHVFTLYAMVQKQLIRHRKLYVAFIDFKKAFDSISRSKLWGILEKNGLNGNILQALKSMYKIVKAKVRVGGDFTDSFMCARGLKQGEVCSPVIFSLFINELTRDVLADGMHGIQLSPDFIQLLILLFADDIALISDSPIGLQKQLNILYDTAKRLDLIVNLEKSNVVVFRNGGYLGVNERWFYGKETLKTVNVYKYLGIFLSTRLSFTATMEDLASRARKGVIAIIRTLWAIGEHSHAVFFKMFDCQIQPVLTYGAEIWGLTKNQEVIERVHLYAIKRFLGVHSKAPRHLIYGETGRFPLYVLTYIKCVKFWLRLLRLNNDRFSKKAYNMLLHLQKQNYVTWACGLRNVLYMYGFGEVWEAHGVGNEKLFIRCFKQRLIDCAKQNWHSSLMSHECYNMYAVYNQSITKSQYLLTVKNFFIRRLLSRFRIGMSNLNCRFLQYNAVSDEKKVCPFCQTAFETEYHFVLVCPMYQTLREEHLFAKYYRKPTLSKFAVLMSCVSECVITKLSVFLYKAFGRRAELLKTISSQPFAVAP
eukprot:TRINITY_DN2374_c0_g1_i12.p1 TRINITY_DN2374_c0_g1~~TRINITY_DN2374_c0_g1_i12.p1  ORF type:complete len:1135 (+),score=79.90 TRINITY_DN2374_c0_g1_i12:1880-5284(+)